MPIVDIRHRAITDNRNFIYFIIFYSLGNKDMNYTIDKRNYGSEKHLFGVMFYSRGIFNWG